MTTMIKILMHCLSICGSNYEPVSDFLSVLRITEKRRRQALGVSRILYLYVARQGHRQGVTGRKVSGAAGIVRETIETQVG